MFERYLAEALTAHFRHIVTDFDADKVKVSVWNGEVILRDLTLRCDAIQQLQGGIDLPFQISYGHIGTFELHIPWNIMRLSQRTLSRENEAKTRSSGDSSRSCSLVLSDVNILISPGVPPKKNRANSDESDDDVASNTTKDERKDVQGPGRIRKERRVQNILDETIFRRNLRQQQEDKIGIQSNNGQWPQTMSKQEQENDRRSKSFVRNLVQKILASLTITVKNIHIRYEDTGDCLGFDSLRLSGLSGRRRTRHRPPFTVGISLEEFCLVNTSHGPPRDDELYHIPTIDGMPRENDEMHQKKSGECASLTSSLMQHKLAAAKKLAVYWDSNVSSDCLIHQTVKRLNRQHDRLLNSANFFDHGHDLSNGDESDFSTASCNKLDEDDYTVDVKQQASNHDIILSLMNDALLSTSDSKTYIIEPVSPSLHFTIVNDVVLSSNSSEGSTVEQTPSRAILTLPSSQMNVTKNILEDLAYLRRSVKLWHEMETSLLTRKIYAKLSSYRPQVTPLEDPRSWWKYSFQAVRTLSQMERQNDGDRGSCKRSWLSLIKLMRVKRQYLELYKALIDPRTSLEKKEIINQTLWKIEESLASREIVAFRFDAVIAAIKDRNVAKLNGSRDGPIGGEKVNNWWKWKKGGQLNEEDCKPSRDHCRHMLFSEKELLTVKYRETVHAEMVEALGLEDDIEYESFFDRNDQNEHLRTGYLLLKENVTYRRLDVTILCSQLIVQIDDVAIAKKKSNRQRCPILQVRCASIQKISLYPNSNWNLMSTFASLEVLDLMESSYTIDRCPKLLTRKRQWVCHFANIENASAEPVIINGDSYEHGGTLYLNRYVQDNDERRSISTSIHVVLSPMEIVYAPETVQKVSRMLSTTRTSELSNDYQRLKQVISGWRAEQKQRLMEVLAQKEKNILINIDIAAPVFLMHDKLSNGTLVIDLGRLEFNDTKHVPMNIDESYDKWRLSLHNVQVLSVPRPDGVSPSVYSLLNHNKSFHLVEPFSLEFIIKTDFSGESSHGLNSHIVIDATLPRLVFNLNSSAVRLVHRLFAYRRLRKAKAKSDETDYIESFQKTSLQATSSNMAINYAEKSKNTSLLQFQFSAPLIALRLTNDVDGRDCSITGCSGTTQIAELVIRGIGGDLSCTSVSGKLDNATFCARLKSLQAHDFYQQAGGEFSFLLSSKLVQNDMFMRSRFEERFSTIEDLFSFSVDEQNDLVQFMYCSKVSNFITEKEISIGFNELYVEWNPETIAAVQKALRLSHIEQSFFKDLENRKSVAHFDILSEREMSERIVTENSLSADDSFSFFDAMEDESVEEEMFLSEVSSDDENTAQSSITQFERPNQILSPMIAKAMKAMSFRLLRLEEVTEISLTVDSCTPPERHHEKTSSVSVMICFELSKLRVRFNKESRLRRLVVAEMTKTTVNYVRKPHGGSKTVATLGNFTLTDPSVNEGYTLYGEILGLKTDLNRSGSMLEIIHETFPRGDGKIQNRNESRNFLKIDSTLRRVEWCDTSLTMRFSPMRFVYLQQLWMEIADYFFEGIIGYEVWGKQRPDVLKRMDEYQQKVDSDILSSYSDILCEECLPGASADGIKFLRFDITVESPVVIFPVQYRSPQHLRFDLDKICVTNEFKGSIEVLREQARYVQWYNNCYINFEGLKIISWCGNQINISEDSTVDNECNCSVPMNILLQWPIGPSAHTIVPKWNFNCTMDNIRLVLRKNDYSLFQNIIRLNIGEESRHLDEWRALQNLPPDELAAYKEKVMVHFGYDKKDGPPTTFHFAVELRAVKFHFCLDENNPVADLQGSRLQWSLLRRKDKVSHQNIAFHSIYLTHTSSSKEWLGAKDLLFPLKENGHVSDKKSPQLIYTSSSHPNGDNVRFLVVNDACIFLIYPAWMFVKSFFQNLPHPDIMSTSEVLSSVQIADRWYKIQKGETLQMKDTQETRSNFIKRDSSTLEKSNYQFRVMLCSPRIVLVGEPDTCDFEQRKVVTLSLGHLDFLYENNSKSCLIEKTLFLHELQLFTGSTIDAISIFNEREQHSLLYPLCLGAGIISRCDNQVVKESRKWISSDVVSVRTAFTDMTLAIDVFSKLMSDYRYEVSRQYGHERRNMCRQDFESQSSIQEPNEFGSKDVIGIACGGFDLLVIDDSGRHFSGAQDLIQVSISGILYKSLSNPETGHCKYDMMLQLNDIELADCLQNIRSPFRTVATGNHVQKDKCEKSKQAADVQKLRWKNMNETVFMDFMSWEKHSMVKSQKLGYEISFCLQERIKGALESKMRQPFDDSNLIELHHKISANHDHTYNLRIRDIALQWNPSMAIALQRFLGRLRKRVKEKQLTMSQINTDRDRNSHFVTQRVSFSKSKTALCQIDSLTLCLNKEHQHRRLVQITSSNFNVSVQLDEHSRLQVSGYLGDLNAWDSDGNRKGQVPICPRNRVIVGVLHSPDESIHDKSSGSSSLQSSDPQRLLVFNYYSNPNNKNKFSSNDLNESSLDLPEWIRHHIDHDANVYTIDDFLFLKVATLRFNHIKERSGEILDYLSNGLPGKGMGATSRAAKGFISKRIKTRSFAKILINSPQVYLPRHRGNQDGIVMCLGDVKLKSWFCESSIDEVRNINLSRAYNIETKIPTYDDKLPVSSELHGRSKESRYWWRVLSVSVLGLGWRVNKGTREVLSNLLHIENPVNIHLQMQKPPLEENLPTVVHCKVTAMEFVLRYSEYMLLRAVLKENVTKKLDKTLWDNPEDTFTMDEDLPHTVRYSENARFVRYGNMREGDNAEREYLDESASVTKVTTAIDLNFSLDGVTLVLHRDDSYPIQKGDMTGYDIVLFEIDDIHFHMNLNSDSTKTGTIKLNSFALTDIGDIGRLERESNDSSQSALQRTKLRNPSAFTVIAKGYNCHDPNGNIIQKDPQLIISIDTNAPSSSDIDLSGLKIGVDSENILITSVRITLNRMNINPLIKPLREIADFMSGNWSNETTCSVVESRDESILYYGDVSDPKTDNLEETLQIKPKELSRKFRGMNISIITNYPRVFLVADETDQFTRALVLRGLTVMNATILKEVGNNMPPDYVVISAQCQVHSLESYINPEPRKVLENILAEEDVSDYKTFEERLNEPKNVSDDLGIALIEPVSASFTIRQLKRLNFPTLREAFLSIEPISTTLSFEDMKLLEVVISKWKSERDRLNKSKTPLGVEDSRGAFDTSNGNEAHDDVCLKVHASNSFIELEDEKGKLKSECKSFEVQDSVTFCMDCIPKISGEGHHDNICLPRSFISNLHSRDIEFNWNFYQVSFHTRKLGLALKKKDGTVVVEEITDDKLFSKIGKGDELYSINGRFVSQLSFQAVLNLIANSERPIIITFRKKMASDDIEACTSLTDNPRLDISFSKSELNSENMEMASKGAGNASAKSSMFRNVTTVSLRKGVSNGIEVEKSLFGDIPVVSDVQYSLYSACSLESNPDTFLPRQGSFIIAINTRSTQEIVYEETLQSLRENCKASEDDEHHGTYTLTFLDLNPEDLGQVDRIDVVITGMKFTVIDDINGRDMPLLRKTLQSVALKVERGLGLECNSIDVTQPSIAISPTPGYSLISDCHEVVVEPSEIITRFCISAEISIDYYNARIAVWEPLVEPAHLSMEIESQNGSQLSSDCRPGVLSVAISDFQPSDGCRSNQPFVCLNITDAAADILCTALREWQYWRTTPNDSESYTQEMAQVGNDSARHHPNKDLSLGFNLEEAVAAKTHMINPRSNLGAAQNAADAALIYARRRGLESHKMDNSKPFVLRNRTGMKILFAPEIEVADQRSQNKGGRSFDLKHFEHLGLTKVDDGEEARFNLETLEGTGFSSGVASSKPGIGKKVRSYDGKYPFLSVLLETANDTKIELMEHLSVVRIGSMMRNLAVLKLERKTYTLRSSVNVLWSVGLENNRRIITISSAIRLSSGSCGIPIEIGFREFNESNDDTEFEVQCIGSSNEIESFWLPLWLELSPNRIEIYVRPCPNDRSFRWSDNCVLRLEQSNVISQPTNQASSFNRDWNVPKCEAGIKCSSESNCDRTAWLAYECIYETPDIYSEATHEMDSSYKLDASCQIKCIDIRPGLTVRNALPIMLQWEVCEIDPYNLDNIPLRIDGSTTNSVGDCNKLKYIPSGQGIDVLGCDIYSKNICIRFRCDRYSEWSEYIPINYSFIDNRVVKLPLSKPLNKNHLTDSREGNLFQKRNINCQSLSSLMIPTTIGLQVSPRIVDIWNKMHPTSNIIGFDIVAYTELWIKNLTTLPIVIGAPSNQFYSRTSNISHSLSSINDAMRKSAAEAALYELSSILEFGDKGHDIIGEPQKHDILTLPQQDCDYVTEEVFEFAEIESGKVMRQWWAGEHGEVIRPDVHQFDSLVDIDWEWQDETWTLDISGECKASQGGWESCVVPHKFSPNRIFNPLHRYRRRRWFRRKVRAQSSANKFNCPSRVNAISSFHQPYCAMNKVSKAKFQGSRKTDPTVKNTQSVSAMQNEEDETKLFLKVGDSSWSSPAVIPSSGASHGIIRIPASRWPSLLKSTDIKDNNGAIITGNGLSVGVKGPSKIKLERGSLSSSCFDLSYRITAIEGLWGDYSRLLVIYPRFYVRNDSQSWHMEVKQSGTPDQSSLQLKPGYSKAFYWTDINSPELMCVRLSYQSESTNKSCLHGWSGGLDISALGMVPLRIEKQMKNSISNQSSLFSVVRVSIELRSGTGGTGILVSLKDELDNGEDALYRIENLSPFPIWILQDRTNAINGGNGDLILPNKKVAYGLNQPYRTEKLGSNKSIPLENLLRLKVGLAPLLSRDGIESTKVIGLACIGDNLRLKPAKLRDVFDEDTIADLMSLNVQCVVSSDGPTRVLVVTILERELTASSVIKNSVRMHTSGPLSHMAYDDRIVKLLKSAANTSIILMRSGMLSKYDPKLKFRSGISNARQKEERCTFMSDCQYYFRASVSGLVLSFIDQVPSEVAVATFRKIVAMSEWNSSRTSEATAALSIDWLQIDNHCPNASFPVALCPSNGRTIDDVASEFTEVDRPFLSVGIVLAPNHKSRITCLKGATITVNDIHFGTDLAFVMRIQQLLLGLLSHWDRYREQKNVSDVQHVEFSKQSWPMPDFSQIYLLRAPAEKPTSKTMYFEGITILPFTIKFSVAPSVALTSAQAALEGPGASAIHAAVRKGDLLLGEKADGVVGVKIGSKNRTALAVIRGIFKSILVDSLLRCDDVSLNFSGLAVRNHLSTITQLKTYIGHHYLSLLKSNVPALIGSLSAFGNPVGLIRGFGDGVTDFVSEPVKGFKKSVEELDPSYVMDGVARGTGSLARHTVGGIVDSASLLTETFSKNMAVLTLDRKYAQRRDRFKTMPGTNITFVGGVESGMGKLIRGVAEGVIGVVRAPMRGAEKRGVEGFAKGVGKGLLGLVVKPVIGLSDAATDVMVGVKGSLEGASNKAKKGRSQSQIRPRRAFYGRDRRFRPYIFVDAIAAAIMLQTKLGGENYLSHVDLGGRVVILSVKRLLLLGDDGESRLLIKLKNIKRIELRSIPQATDDIEWGVFIFLKTARSNGGEVEVITTSCRDIAKDLCIKIQQAVALLE